MPVLRSLLLPGLALGLVLSACSGDDSSGNADGGSGSSANGGSANGGSASGGSPAGGASGGSLSGSSGHAGTLGPGGAAGATGTAGQAGSTAGHGGSSTSAGGASAGGASAGGTSAGGTSSGGVSAGGSAGSGTAGSGTAGTGAAGTGTAGTGAAGTGTAGTGAAGTGSSGTSGQSGSLFRYGANLGFYTSKVPDADGASLAVAAGANSLRAKLTESFLDTWGDGIEVDDMKAYHALGMDDLVVFLGGPSKAHSTAPAGKQDWELEYYSPKNLYEPIFLASGEVNPDNYWASFVARVAKTYAPYIHTYEIWNEPDQVGGNWQATLDWDKNPPKPADLIWWNDTIFSYIRALRVAHEVIHKLDPDGQVALGGIGYASFLDAILRYSDEPKAGAVGGDYPSRGGAYFDVVSYHYYPVFAPGNSDAGAAGLLALKAELQAKLAAAGVSGKGWVVTESGAPRYALGTSPGGEAYARNYLLKAMTLGHDANLGGIHWFALGDGQKVGKSQSAFDYMGLYFNYSDVQSKAEAKITPTGVAYATLGQVLGGATSDPAATKALALPATVGGAVFHTASGHRAYALWARSDKGEDAKAAYDLASDKPVVVRAWDASQTKQSTTLTPSGGKVALTLTSSPVLVVEQ